MYGYGSKPNIQLILGFLKVHKSVHSFGVFSKLLPRFWSIPVSWWYCYSFIPPIWPLSCRHGKCPYSTYFEMSVFLDLFIQHIPIQNLLVVWHIFYFSIYWEESQLTFISFRGVGIPPTRKHILKHTHIFHSPIFPFDRPETQELNPNGANRIWATLKRGLLGRRCG